MKKTLKKSGAVLTLIGSLALLTSCQSWGKSPDQAPVPKPSIVITWPEFPDPSGVVDRLPDGRVVMPLDYWLNVAEYAIEIENVRQLVEIEDHAVR